MKIILSICIAVLLALSFSAVPAAAEELVVSGSTTIQKRVLEPSAAAIEQATGIKLTVRGINSGRGFKELREGKVRASVSSSPLSLLIQKAGLTDDGTYQEHIIVKDIIVPIVHKSNPVKALTWEQLADIHTGRITNWKDVGGPDMKIIVVTSQPTAATRNVFQKQVMKKEPYIKNKREVKSTRQEVDLVGKYKGGIGAVSEGFVAMNKGKVNVVKTDEISRPLSFLTKGAPPADVQKVIDYLMTPAARKHFK